MHSKVMWDWRYYQLALHIAEWSKDPSTKVGAVIVGEDVRCIAVGYNGFPPGIADTAVRLTDREVKYKLTQHAERNVLDNAQFDVKGGLLVTTQIPCSGCAKSIISKGIARVVYYARKLKEPWESDAQLTMDMFSEVGIPYHSVNS